MYGRRIEVRYAVDPSIRGGLVVRVGDEVIDGSVVTRFVPGRAPRSPADTEPPLELRHPEEYDTEDH